MLVALVDTAQQLCVDIGGSATSLVDWQTRLVVSLFRKGDQRVCSIYRGFILFSLTDKVEVTNKVKSQENNLSLNVNNTKEMKGMK